MIFLIGLTTLGRFVNKSFVKSQIDLITIRWVSFDRSLKPTFSLTHSSALSARMAMIVANDDKRICLEIPNPPLH